MMVDVIVSLMFSMHVGLAGNFNNFHPGVTLTDGDKFVGVYRNSYSKPSFYAGFIQEKNNFEIHYGIVTGYVAPIVPFVAIKKELEKNLKLVVIPSVDVTNKKPGFVIGLEISK